MEKSGEICKKHGCSDCCDPVRVNVGFGRAIGDKLSELPFEALDEVHIPADELDTTRLEAYKCRNLDSETGLCKNYENRPQICRNSGCRALDTDDEDEQKRLIKDQQEQDFIVCKRKK